MSMFEITRADGEDMYEEFGGFRATSIDDWSSGESEVERIGETTEYIITEWQQVRRVSRFIEPSATDRRVVEPQEGEQ